MKRISLMPAIFAFLLSSCFIEAQELSPELKYRRSSLLTMLIDDGNFPKKEVIINAYNNAPFPEKYNDHNIGIKTISLKGYSASNEERIAFGLKPKSAFATKLAQNDSTDLRNDEIPLFLTKYFNQNKIGNQIIAKWFDRDSTGAFNMNTIAERGYYNASEMEADIAKGSAKGLASIADAGIELIGNTFIVCSKLNFVSNEIAAAAIRATAYKIAESKLSGIQLLLAKKAADIIYNKAKVGYTVWTHSYLFQLDWNDSIEASFYQNYWFDKNNIDPEKKKKFEQTDLFKLKYIGTANSSSIVTFSFKKHEANRTEEEVIALSTIRNVDHVFSKLQKEYDVFMPKVPLLTGTPITAKIGRKEGLDGGEKFEVLEQSLNPSTGLTEYKRVGTIKVNRKLIWDDRFEASFEDKETATIDRTTFDGPEGKFFAGMLIKQIK